MVERFAELLRPLPADDQLAAEDVEYFRGAVDYAESVAAELCLSAEDVPLGRWGTIQAIVGIPRAVAPSECPDADALAASWDLPTAPSSGPSARLAFKSELHARQDESGRHQRWAARAGGSWEALTLDLAEDQRWQDTALAIVTSARLTALTSPVARQSGRRTPVLPTPSFAQDDLRDWGEPTLFVSVDERGTAIVVFDPEDGWQGRVRRPPTGWLEDWWVRWRATVDRSVIAGLDELLDVLGLKESHVARSRHVVAAGRARALPLAQAVQHAGATFTPIVHLLGGIGPDASLPPAFTDTQASALVALPPRSGIDLPAVAVEADAVAEIMRPVTDLRGDQATRSWLQRAMSSARDVALIDHLHFAGHGVFGPTPSGVTASGMRLMDGELFGADDLRAIDSSLRLLVVSACDVAASDPFGETAVDPWPLASVMAGVEWVIAAAWPVFDEATLLIMDGFYRRWSAGREVPDSLSEAAREVASSSTDALCSQLEALCSNKSLAANLIAGIGLAAGTKEFPLATTDASAAFGLYCA